MILMFSVLCLPKASAASSAFVNNGIYYIKNQRSGKYLTASGTSSGSGVTQHNFTGSTSQQFKITLTGSDYYFTPMSATGLRLNVNGSDADDVSLKLTTYDSTLLSQKFGLVFNNNNNRGTYKIKPKLSSTRVVTVWNEYRGSSIWLKVSSATDLKQDWILERVSTVSLSIAPALTISAQGTNNTCGPASVRMVLDNFGITKTESEIKTTAAVYGGGDHTICDALTKTLNFYLIAANKSTRYKYNYINSSSAAGYMFTIGVLATAGYPTVVLFYNPSSTSYYPYTTGGHYVVANATKKTANTNSENYIITSDPHWVSNSVFHTGVWEIPPDVLLNYTIAHSGLIIHMTTE